MLLPPHPHFDLQSLAALLSPRPELRVPDCGEAEAEQLLAAMSTLVGPTDHAEWLGGLEEDRGELRVALPDLDLDGWLPLSRLVAASHATFQLVPTDSATWEEAVLQGRVIAESIEAPGLVARRWSTVHGEPAGEAQVTRHPTTHPDVSQFLDDVQRELEGARLVREEATVVVRRRDGRTGIDLPMVLPERSTRVPDPRALAVHGLATVAVQRLGHRTLRVAPDLEWQDGDRFCLRLWFLLGHLPGLPQGTWQSPLRHPGPLATGTRVVSLCAPDEEADLLTALAERCPHLRSAPPTWIRGSHRSAWHADSWVDTGSLPVLQLPTLALGLEPHGADIDEHPHQGEERWIVRYRSAIADRDFLEVVEWRTAHERDRTLVAHLMERADDSLRPFPTDRWVVPVRDTQGRDGIAVHLHPDTTGSEQSWCAALDLLSALNGPGPLGTVAITEDRVVVHLWFDGGNTQLPREWALSS